MTPILSLSRIANPARTVSVTEVKRMLREAAFVLRMTRKVKADILRDATRSERPAPHVADRFPAALGA